MKLITGGAYQGKLDYAKKTYHQPKGWIDGRTCKLEEIWTCGGIDHFEVYVRRMLADAGRTESEAKVPPPGSVIWEPDSHATDAQMQKQRFSDSGLVSLGRDAAWFAQQLLERNQDILIVTTELGCGIVPMEREDRLWREAVGRICTCLAQQSEEVVRVMCGIGTRIK
jgi:adenosylcobinamide kinase/adenosylcobinamide-phosphate guanylyltransferase